MNTPSYTESDRADEDEMPEAASAEKADRPSASFMRGQLDQALETDDDRIFSTRWSAGEARDILSTVRHIIADADGTILDVGGTEIRPSQARKIQLLAEQGVKTVIVTGKPMSEAMKMFESVDQSVPLSVICEKGAYRIVRGEDGLLHPRYHLSSRDMEKQAARLKELFNTVRPGIEARHAVRIVPAGDGGHESLLSIDIMKADLPEGYEKQDRGSFKVRDRAKHDDIKAELRTFLDANNFSDWKVTDLGNGNYELHPASLSKSIAVERELEGLEDAALLLGDSGNDRDMFTLSKSRPNTYSGLIYHADTPEELADEADFGTSGVAMAERFFSSALHARGVPEGLFVASNTAPFGYNKQMNRLDVKVGMPVAIAELVGEIENCRWVFVGEDDFSGYERTAQLGLKGKLVPSPISEDMRDRHYKQVSNQELWPLMHKPEAQASVRSAEGEEGEQNWHTYDEVCRVVAEELHRQESDFHSQPENKYSTAVTWVHDYQMMAVGEHLKNLPDRGKSVVGYSWHIPFPPAEVLVEEVGEPRARQLMSWFARYDVVSFHTASYAENYRQLCEMLGIDAATAVIKPISVNVEEVQELTREALRSDHRFTEYQLHKLLDINGLHGEHADELPETEDQTIRDTRDETRHSMRTILAGFERCDDTKASIDRLEAWAKISRTNPELFRDVKVIEVLVRSREGIELYDELYSRIEGLVAEIEHNVGRKSVIHLDRINQREDVVAAMAKADTVVITPRRDGFNMSAAEMSVVLTEKRRQGDTSGNLLISQGMGYHESLVSEGMPDAVHSFPGEVTSDNLVEPLKQALRGEIRDADHEALEEYFTIHTLSTWTREIMGALLKKTFEKDYARVSA